MKSALAFILLFGTFATSVSADESPAFKVIEVQQTGGFAGVNITYRITPDGKFSHLPSDTNSRRSAGRQLIPSKRRDQKLGPHSSNL